MAISTNESFEEIFKSGKWITNPYPPNFGQITYTANTAKPPDNYPPPLISYDPIFSYDPIYSFSSNTASGAPTEGNTMTKLKIGSKVSIASKEKLEKLLNEGGYSLNSLMVSLAGKKCQITQIHDSGNYFQVNIPGYAELWWHREALSTSIDTENMKVKFDSIVIDDEKINQIKEAICQREYTDLIFNDWGFGEIFEKGTAISLLFYGVPGTGKTLTAQAIADYLSLELKIIGAADIETSEPGGAERNIRKIFKDAGEKTVILLDECDSLLVNRNEVGHIMASQINALLAEIEQFKGVVIFTTNRLGTLDPALDRRITAKVEFPFPSREARERIWKRMIPKACPIGKDVQFKKLAEFPLTGGDIKNCVLNAARRAAYLKLKKLSYECFLYAIDLEIEQLHALTEARDEWRMRDGKFIRSHSPTLVQETAGRLEIKRAKQALPESQEA